MSRYSDGKSTSAEKVKVSQRTEAPGGSCLVSKEPVRLFVLKQNMNRMAVEAGGELFSFQIIMTVEKM